MVTAICTTQREDPRRSERKTMHNQSALAASLRAAICLSQIAIFLGVPGTEPTIKGGARSPVPVNGEAILARQKSTESLPRSAIWGPIV